MKRPRGNASTRRRPDWRRGRDQQYQPTPCVGPRSRHVASLTTFIAPCDPDVELPIAVREVHAPFTSDAMRAKVNGRVVLQGIVDRDGAIRDVLVLQPLEPSLDAEAQRAFAPWV